MPYTMTDDDRRRCDLLAVAAREALDAVKMGTYAQVTRMIGLVYIHGWTPENADDIRELAHSLGPDAEMEPLRSALLAVTL